MLGLFDNTLTADDKYSRHKRENFAQKIQIQVSQKPKTFSRHLIAFPKYTSSGEYFETKMSLIA